jgi:hypothetical protein
MFQYPVPIINLPPAPPNHEWLKILASALAGLLAGVMLEPLKRKLQWEHDMSKMLNAVLTDYRIVELNVRDWEKHYKGTPEFNLPGFKYYWENKRDLFYETMELQILVALAQTMDMFKRLAEIGETGGEDLATKLNHNISEMKTLNLEPSGLKRLWRKVSRKYRYRRGIQTSAWLKGKSTLQESGPRDEQRNI